MAQYGIQSHNFDQAKNEIARMAANAPRSTSFSSVPTEGTSLGGFLFGTNHNVTGAELNRLIKEVQASFNSVHRSTLQIYSALNSVYTAFESLDKDYISYILKNLEIAKNAADQANRTAKALTLTIQKTKERLEEVKRDCHNEVESLNNSVSQKINTFSNDFSSRISQTANELRSAIADAQTRSRQDCENVKESLSFSIKENETKIAETNLRIQQTEKDLKSSLDSLNMTHKLSQTSMILPYVSVVISIIALVLSILK